MKTTSFRRTRKANRQPSRRAFRPVMERLETRLAPANVPVLTRAYDSFLSQANTREDILTPARVNARDFGRLFSYPVDGYTYAQPLYVPNLSIPGRGTCNVVFVATQHDSVYAFDADNPSAKAGACGGLYWQRTFINPAAGITTVPAPSEVGSADIVPEIGITGTPVIDPATNTLYVAPKTREVRAGVVWYVHRMHALNLTTGSDRVPAALIGETRFGGPDGGFTNNTTVSVAGVGEGSSGGVLRFNSLRALQRPALALNNGVVYVTFASHGDTRPYHGWVVGYRASDLAQTKVFNVTPDAGGAGIWMSGGGLAFDAQNNMYFAVGNGFDGPGGISTFNLNTGGPTALGQGGGGLGYQGLARSAAVVFRNFPTRTGLATGGAFGAEVGMPGIDFNASARTTPPHTFRATLSYDGTTLTQTLRNETTGATFNNTYPVNLATVVGGSTAWVGFTAATGGLNARNDILTWTYTPTVGAGIDHAAGFASNSDLQANGHAVFAGSVARLTPATNDRRGSIFSRNQVNITNFTTTFTFQMAAGSDPIADGLTFTLQANPPGRNYSEAVLKLCTQVTAQCPTLPPEGLRAVDHFVPFDWLALDAADADLGSGGTMILPEAVGDPLPSGGRRRLFVETGKTGRMYLMDRDDLGQNALPPGPDRVRQTVTIGGPGVWGNPAFIQDGPNTGLIYYWGTSTEAKAFRITNGIINPAPVTQTTFASGFPGVQPSLSANGSADAILWGLRVDNFGQNGREELFAFNAYNLSQQLYSSNATGLRDVQGGSVKFTFPIVSNGKVFAGANGTFTVYGLFPEATKLPAAPSNLTARPLSGSQIELNWVNNAANATGVMIFRSLDGKTFTQVNTVARDVTRYVDTGLAASTLYSYRVVATNQLGDSDPSKTASARTRIAAPVVQVQDVCVGCITLGWTATANDHYDIERSADGTTFKPIASVGAGTTRYADMGLATGTWFYRVTAFSVFPEGTDQATSGVARGTIGPVNLDHSAAAGGFSRNDDLRANGSAFFSVTEQLLRLNNDFGQAGSAFSIQRVGIRGFRTTFTWRLHEGTQPNPADGFTFTLQTNAPTALGAAGGSLGYQNINNSVAIKFDVFNNEGETDNSTGIFFNGSFPGVPHRPGEVNVPLGGTGLNLRNQNQKRAVVTYDGTAVRVTITDLTTMATASQTYTVNIPNLIGADTAFVGFTGGTGGLFSLQDVLTWTYDEDEAALAPRAPTDLKAARVRSRDFFTSDVAVTWNCNNAYTAQGFRVERSTDGGRTFTEVAVLPVDQTSYLDKGVSGGTYYYRVRSFNKAGASRYTNVDGVRTGGGIFPTVVDQIDGFTVHEGIATTGSATFFPNADPVGTFPAHQDVGGVAARGGATFAAGTYTVRASGADIWDTADSFHFVYKQLAGDGEIVARVVMLGDTDFWAKAGVMIRESLTAGARNAFMMATHPGAEAEAGFQWRTATGGGTADSRSGFGSHPRPVWLRVVRSGNNFSGFVSRTGAPGSWVQQGPTVALPMGATVFAGLALTAHNNDGRINVTTFDNVTVTGESPPLPPSVLRLTDGGFGQAGGAFTDFRVGVTNFFTAFAFRITPGTAPLADGFAFVIQGNSPTALGPAGGGLGYGPDQPGPGRGLRNSVAVKFDVFNNAGEGVNSTGLFSDGRSPTVREAGLSADFPDQTVSLDGSGIDLNSQHLFVAALSYDGTTLTQTIGDIDTGVEVTFTYTVDVAALVGGELAYVGFTGGTGGLSAVQDISQWLYLFFPPIEEGGAAPASVVAPGTRDAARWLGASNLPAIPAANAWEPATGPDRDDAALLGTALDESGLAGVPRPAVDVVRFLTADSPPSDIGKEAFDRLFGSGNLFDELL